MIRVFAIALAFAAHAQTTGTVDGTVVNSTNGQAMGGAFVILEGAADNYATRADGRGQFRIANALPGSYVAKVEREGFRPLASRCAVQAGQDVRLELRLNPLGAITGRVTDAEGDPVSHATVEALRYAYPRGKRELTQAARATTDDRGEYRLADLPAGRYYVRAALLVSTLDMGNAAMRMRGTKPTLTFTPTFLGGSRDVADARQVDVAAGGELPDAHVQLRPDAYYTLRVTVTGQSDTPVMVSCRPTTPRGGIMGAFGGSMGSGRTIQCPDHVPGRYIVEASDQKLTRYARKTVPMLYGDVDVALQLALPVRLSGAVRVDGNAALSRAAMRVTLEGAEEWDNAQAPVSAAGVFTLAPAQPIAYRVRVSIPAGGYLKSIYQGTRALAAPRIDLGRATEPLSIEIGTDGGKVEGVALEGAAVVLIPAGALKDWPDLVRSTVAGADGKFTLRDVRPGEYQLLAWEDAEPGAPLDPEFRAPFLSRAAPVSVKAGESVSLTVVPIGR